MHSDFYVSRLTSVVTRCQSSVRFSPSSKTSIVTRVIVYILYVGAAKIFDRGVLSSGLGFVSLGPFHCA